MPKHWEKGFQVAAALLGLLVILPLMQMVLRKNPLNEIDLSQLKSLSLEPEQSSEAEAKPHQPEPLPTDIKQRTDKLNSSGILGRIPQPPPMALIGIAEPYAFVRTPQGQTGKVKEGESLGGVKVLRVGANRILVEHEGRKSELQIFSGIGSNSLLSN